MTTPPLPEQIELHRDRMLRRNFALKSSVDAERFIEAVGFVNTLTDFAPLVRTPSRDATSYGLERARGISNTFSLSEESILISLNLRTTVS